MTAGRASRSRLGALLLVSLLAACGQSAPPWGLRDISGLMPSLDFTLTSAGDGGTVHGSDFRGQVVLLYFGYTHCPDVCPTTLSLLSRAVSALMSPPALRSPAYACFIPKPTAFIRFSYATRACH